MANCRDFTYIIAFTDNARQLIQLQQNALNLEIVDIALVGKTRLAYGEIFNENLLHLLEHFASPSDVETPDTSTVNVPLLEHPTLGQLWFNKRTGSVNAFVGNQQWWKPIISTVASSGSSGTILDGEYLPLPNNISDISECQIFVSPFYLTNVGSISTYNVSVDANGLVTAKYTVDGIEYSGSANYIIFGISGLTSGLRNFCGQPTTTPPTSPQPTPTPTPTPLTVIPALDSGNLYGWGQT